VCVCVYACMPLAVVIRSSLTPFDCTTTVDGTSSLFADPSIRCGVTVGPHARMRAAGGAMLALFTVGVPVLFAVLLFHNRAAIVADQRLRQRGEGDSIMTNPHIRVRQRYRKLYEDYKPQHMHWKLVLLARKCVFAVIVVLLRGNIRAQVRGRRLCCRFSQMLLLFAA
jgi:hypothetical protein